MAPLPSERVVHADLDHRLRARALVLAREPGITALQAADALVAMAGVTPAAPIAARRALARLRAANGLRPDDRTGRAVEALRLALARVEERWAARRRPAATGDDGDGRRP